MKHEVTIECNPCGGVGVAHDIRQVCTCELGRAVVARAFHTCGITHEIRHVCTCGWKGQSWQGRISEHPGTEALVEANAHKLDVLLKLLQPEPKPTAAQHTFSCDCLVRFDLRTNKPTLVLYCAKHMPVKPSKLPKGEA